jgi:hypothetical protein
MTDPMRPDHEDGIDEAELEAIVSRGPSGAFAVAGVAAAIVTVIFYLFYFLVYLPRGAVQ